MFARLIARFSSGVIRTLTGARALWLGCSPVGEQRVYYGNHSSHGDFVLIWSSLPPPYRYRVRPVAAAEYWERMRGRRYLIRSVFNAVLIERDAQTRTHDPVQAMCEAVDGGDSLILFPEGTRNKSDEGVLPFKSGIYQLALKRPEVEFVPVWIDNLKRVMPKNRWLPLPLLCTTTFGAPFRLQEGEDRGAFLERARTALLALSPESSRETSHA
ncbi:MAG: 1-acyl-sn-glycerol-3-phosphate acyltransferase [Xanthomonadaceae bacterium]|nr:1-acyl-sn-glycerol-3-phosphate acyltransferase [Xanthomonadaceae bacterium]